MTAKLLKNNSSSTSLGIAADWAHALNENGTLLDVLGRLAVLVNAEAVMIVRKSNMDQRIRIVEHLGMQTGKVWPPAPRSFSALIIGAFIEAAKVGSIWKLTDSVPFEWSATAAEADSVPADIAEIVTSPLETASGHIDLLEFHFKHRPAEHDLNLLIMLLGTLAIAWGRRTPALVAKRLAQGRRASLSSVTAESPSAILDCDNPAQLSRSEFRVCSLLKEGMTVCVIAKALSVRPATVRSHLSSVFSKTGMSGQVELLHELNKVSQRSRVNGSNMSNVSGYGAN